MAQPTDKVSAGDVLGLLTAKRILRDRARRGQTVTTAEINRMFAPFGVTTAGIGAENVDEAAIIDQELNKLPYPRPIPVARVGPSGVADLAHQILRRAGVQSFDETAFRTAVKQAIRDLQSPTRRI